MDYFKIFTLIFMILITFKLYFNETKTEGFEGTTQNTTSGIDDTNAINTLAQIAKNLMAGGVTVPGNMIVNGDVTTGALLSKGPSASLQYFSRNGNGKQFTWYTPDGDNSYLWHPDKPNLFNITKNGDVTTTGNLTVSGTTTTPVLHLGNKFRLSGVGDAHGNDDWIRLFGVDNKGYHGGIAMNKCHIQTADFHVAGRNILAEIDALKASKVGFGVNMSIQATNDQGQDRYKDLGDSGSRTHGGNSWSIGRIQPR